MPDYKPMYYYLVGRTATAIDILETATNVMEANAKAMMASVESFTMLKEKLKLAQQTTEDMFIDSEDNESDE